MPVTEISRVTETTLRHARSLSDNVTAVVVRFDDDDGPDLEEAWQAWDPGVELVTLRSRYHSVVRPIVRYVRQQRRGAGTLAVVLIPVMAPRRFYHRILHNQLDLALAGALRLQPDVIVARIPFQLHN